MESPPVARSSRNDVPKAPASKAITLLSHDGTAHIVLAVVYWLSLVADGWYHSGYDLHR